MHYLLLEAAAAQTKPGNSGWVGMLPMIGMFAVLYFLLIRPQAKKQKELQKMLNSIKIKDKVVTSGGIIGQVSAFKEDGAIVVIKVDNATNAKLEIQKSAIAGVIGVINEEKNQK